MPRPLPPIAMVIAALLALVVTLLVGFSIHTTRAFITETGRVTGTHDALHELERLLGTLEDAEDANRGFLLTAKDDYLVDYQVAEQAWAEHYGRLLALTAEDPQLGPPTAALRPLIDARLARLRQGVAMMTHDPQQARSALTQGEGETLMSRLRGAIDALHAEMEDRLARDVGDAHHLAWMSEGLDWGAGATALAMIVGGVLALRQQWQGRVEAEQQVRRTNESLERQVGERTAELARANERLRAQASELGRANQELEAFSSTVSHDLRAPLRVIEGLARIVRRRSGSGIETSTQQDLELLESNARKMRALVDDLLAFSRLGRGEIVRSPVAMRELAEECWDALALERAERRIELALGALPPCGGDTGLLRQVLMNLLGNAIKYTRPREIAHVEIAGEIEGIGVHYQVRDDGVGFDMDDAARVFDVFTRLHGDDQFEGTGVGLATVRRIVERHGGRVWAESAVDRGTAIHFTLPGSG